MLIPGQAWLPAWMLSTALGFPQCCAPPASALAYEAEGRGTKPRRASPIAGLKWAWAGISACLARRRGFTTQQGRLQADLQGRCPCLEGHRQGATLGWPCPPFAPGLGALTPSAASTRRHPCARSSDPVLQQEGVGLRPGLYSGLHGFGGEGLAGKPGGPSRKLRGAGRGARSLLEG